MYACVFSLNLHKIAKTEKHTSFLSRAEYVSKRNLREPFKLGTQWGYNYALNKGLFFNFD